MYFEFCTEKQLENIYKELDVSEESLKRDVQYLMDWLETQPHLPNVTDEEFLTHFLLRCKNSMEKTKKKLELYYSFRALMPEIYSNRNPEDVALLESLDEILLTPLPKLTKEGNRVIFLRFFNPKRDKMLTSELALAGMTIVFDGMLKFCNSRSYVIVFDFDNLTAHAVAVGFTILKKSLTIATKTIPARFHSIYLVNMMAAAEPLVSIGKTFVKKELSDRMIFWKKKASDLKEVIDEDVLPSTYGGKAPPMEEIEESWKNFAKVHFKTWVMAENSVKADLSKKPIGDTLYKDLSLYGVEGTFRNIAID